ncbi:MAG TPA: nitronate monooxygenase, partial [Verrucomicrobiae bacterium]
VFTDPLASPTGFPFKVVQLPGTQSEPGPSEARIRLCDLGYLRQAYRAPNGKIGYRCPAEPVEDYVRKGGEAAEARGRLCVCNGLLATVELGQSRTNGEAELPLVTAGNDVTGIAEFLGSGRDSYSAAEVVQRLHT